MDAQTQVDDFLEHFGTKGMKWGVRKAGSGAKAVGSMSLRGAKWGGKKAGSRVDQFIERQKQIRRDRGGSVTKTKERTRFTKSPKRLTNAELEQRIKRMQMEKLYNDLNRKDISKGRALTTEILGGAGKNVARKTATAGLTFAVQQALKKKGGEGGKEIAGLMKKNK